MQYRNMLVRHAEVEGITCNSIIVSLWGLRSFQKVNTCYDIYDGSFRINA
jgi:hypothetical protein